MGDSTVPKTKRRTEKGVKKGFALMDWIRLTQHAKDLAGLKGSRPRAIRMEEVAQHASEFDVWTVLNGRVYNLTPYLHYHPGGIKILLTKGVAGADCTDLFNKYHRWVNGATMLKKCEIGWLASDIAAGPAPAEEDEEAEDDQETQATDDDESGSQQPLAAVLPTPWRGNGSRDREMTVLP